MTKKFDGLYKLIITGILLNSSTLAQDVNRLETIYISEELDSLAPELVDGQIEELDSEVLENEVSSSLDDVLKKSTGATTKGGPRAIGETPQVRGLEAKKIFVYVDGVKQSFYFSNHNYSHLTLDPDNLKSAKVYKSNSSIAEGVSLGGGMVFETKDGRDFLRPGEKFGSLLKYSYEEASRLKAQSFKTYGKSKSGDYLISASLKQSNDIKLSDDTVLKNSGFKNYNYLAKFNNKLSKRETVTFSGEAYQTVDKSPLNATLDPPSDLTNLQGESRVKRETIAISYKQDPSVNKAVNLSFKANKSKQVNQQTRESDSRTEKRVVDSTGLKLRNKSFILGQNLTIDSGLEYISNKVEGRANGKKTSDYPDGRSFENSIFGDLYFKYKGFEISPGARITNFKLESTDSGLSTTRDSNLSKKLSTAYRYKWLKTFANYSEGFNSPKVQDVYAAGLHRPGDGFFIADNYFIPNLSLRPETSKTIEVGVKVERSLFNASDLITLKASRYWSEAKDYIDQEIIDRAIFDGVNGSTQFVNRENVRLTGSDISLSYLLNSLEFGATYSQSIGFDKSQNIWLSSMPADTYTLSMKYYLDRYGASFGYDSIKTNDQNRVNPQTLERTTSTKGYTVHNIFASKEFRRGELRGFKLNVRLDNLTGRVYNRHGSYINEVGRNFKFSMQYKIKHF